MALTSKNDFSKFYFKDFTTKFGTNVRIFGYNYASYSDWLKDDAIECRGIMFEMVDGKPVKILARPMEKFFNLNENPITENIDMSKVVLCMDKMDGSLISTYVDNGHLQTKSKMSISSQQAVEAYQLFLDIKNSDLRNRCLELALAGFTCNFEYIAPSNRVVIAYGIKELVLLNVRHNESGEYVPYSDLKKDPVLRKYLVGNFDNDKEQFTEDDIPELMAKEDIEGYVFLLDSGQRFKLKTYWYSNLHRVKNTLSNNKALFSVVVGNGIDDIKSLFDDDYAINKINKFEQVFLEYLRDSINQLTEFSSAHIGVSRKDYAIAAQTKFKDLNRVELFSIAMQLFTGELDSESMVYGINEVFIKHCQKYVPSEYLVELDQIESD